MCKKENGIYDIAEAAQSYLRELSKGVRYSTGISGVDSITGGGIANGDFAVVGGVTGIGKSSFALSAAYNVALSGGKVCWFSPGETKEVTVSRILSQLMRVGRVHLPKNMIDRTKIDDFICKLKEICELKENFFICDSPLLSAESIARCLDSTDKPDLVVIDSLDSIFKTERDVFVNELYGLAKSRNTAVMLTVGLKYEPLFARKGHRPWISDIARISKRAANLADIIIFLHRDCWWTMNDPNYTGEYDDIIVARSRRNEAGIIPAEFDNECRRWDEKYGVISENSEEKK